MVVADVRDAFPTPHLTTRQDGRPSVLISQNAPHVVSVLIFVNSAKMVDNPKMAFLAPMAGGQRFGDCSSADLGD